MEKRPFCNDSFKECKAEPVLNVFKNYRKNMTPSLQSKKLIASPSLNSNYSPSIVINKSHSMKHKSLFRNNITNDKKENSRFLSKFGEMDKKKIDIERANERANERVNTHQIDKNSIFKSKFGEMDKKMIVKERRNTLQNEEEYRIFLSKFGGMDKKKIVIEPANTLLIEDREKGDKKPEIKELSSKISKLFNSNRVIPSKISNLFNDEGILVKKPSKIINTPSSDGIYVKSGASHNSDELFYESDEANIKQIPSNRKPHNNFKIFHNISHSSNSADDGEYDVAEHKKDEESIQIIPAFNIKKQDSNFNNSKLKKLKDDLMKFETDLK